MNWKKIIAEIQRHGKLTQADIAKEVACGQATISDLFKETTKQPNFSLGQSLMNLHGRVILSKPRKSKVATNA